MRFSGQHVVIIGASGGLGAAFARAFAGEGARLILAARRADALQPLAEELGADVVAVDITRPDALRDFMRRVEAIFPRVDVVVNATGYDVRKPLTSHTDEEIQRSLDVNLLGAILITRAFLPPMTAQKSGVIVHLGGFADGRLAFPYYSVDVATRAGVFSFMEALGREIKGSGVDLLYFCPTAADTEAERPYHSMWAEMGVAVASPQAVAEALLNAIAAQRRIAIMGGLPTRWFARLNSIFPRLADILLLNRYGRILKRHLGS